MEEEETLDEIFEQQYQEFFAIFRIYLIISMILFGLFLISNAIVSQYRNSDLNSEVIHNQFDGF